MSTEQNQENTQGRDNQNLRKQRPKRRKFVRDSNQSEKTPPQKSVVQEAESRVVIPEKREAVIKKEPGVQNEKFAPKQQGTNPLIKKNIRPKKNNSGETLLSIVIPLLNEEDSLIELSRQLESVLVKLVGNRWEVIFIDDGSTDGSFNIIRTINEKKRNFKAIRFRRNYGKSAALQAGFQKATGKIIVTMDADLQDDPTEIPNLIEKLKDGYDLVSGWKKKRHDPFIKKFTSKIFNFFTSVSSGIKLHDFNCGLKAYRRDCAKSLTVYGEMHRYLPALAHWDGFRVAEVPVKHHARKYGKTKFGASRFVKGYLDLLTVLFTTRYLKRPLHFFGTLGTLFGLSGFAINAYLLYEWFLGQTYLSNRPLALFGIALIIVGVQLISIGLLGEMIAKNYVDKINVSIKEKIN